MTGDSFRLFLARCEPLAVALLALALRVHRLGGRSLWFDEAFTVFITRRPWGEGWSALVVDGVHPPLYYWLQKAAQGLLGESEFALRFPSALAGVLAVLLIRRLGSRWAGAQAGRWAAWLMALSPFHVWYSQEARMYAWLTLFSLGAWRGYEDFLISQTSPGAKLLGWRPGGFILFSAAAYLTHYFGLMMPLAQFVHLVQHLRRWPRALRQWVVWQALAALPLSVWVVALARREAQSFGIGWIPTPRLPDIAYTLINFTVGYQSPLVFLHGAGAAIGVALAVRGLLEKNWRREGMRSLTGWCAFGPLALAFALSLRRPVYVDRFLIGSLPAFLLLVAVGMAALRPGAAPSPFDCRSGSLRASLAVALVVAGLWGWGLFRLSVNVKEDWRSAAASLAAASAAEVVVAREAQALVPLGYYYHGSASLRAMEYNRALTPLPELAAGRQGLWLVYWVPNTNVHALGHHLSFDPKRETDPLATGWIAGRGPAVISHRDFPGVTVFHFELP